MEEKCSKGTTSPAKGGFHGTHGSPLDPPMNISTCIRIRKSNKNGEFSPSHSFQYTQYTSTCT